MNMEKYGPWALIIGGSEGIGRAFALHLANAGLNLALVARKQAALDEVAQAVEAVTDVTVRTLSQDMVAPDMVDRVKGFTNDIEVGLLIYNAGAMDRITTFLGDTIEGHLHTVHLNCIGPTRLCHHFGNLMRQRGRGGIVLMSSAVGLAGAYGVPVYGASKAFQTILGEGLWAEFKDFGVSVLSAVIGGVNTPSHERLFGGHLPEGGQDPEVTASEILTNLESGPTIMVGNAKELGPKLSGTDRRTIVSFLADISKEFYAERVNTNPFDPCKYINL